MFSTVTNFPTQIKIKPLNFQKTSHVDFSTYTVKLSTSCNSYHKDVTYSPPPNLCVLTQSFYRGNFRSIRQTRIRWLRSFSHDRRSPKQRFFSHWKRIRKRGKKTIRDKTRVAIKYLKVSCSSQTRETKFSQQD